MVGITDVAGNMAAIVLKLRGSLFNQQVPLPWKQARR
jgi:hypothetical protein